MCHWGFAGQLSDVLKAFNQDGVRSQYYVPNLFKQEKGRSWRASNSSYRVGWLSFRRSVVLWSNVLFVLHRHTSICIFYSFHAVRFTHCCVPSHIMDRGREEDNKLANMDVNVCKCSMGKTRCLKFFFFFFYVWESQTCSLESPRQNFVYTKTAQAIFSSLLQTQKCPKLDFTDQWILIIFKWVFTKITHKQQLSYNGETLLLPTLPSVSFGTTLCISCYSVSLQII